jgi:hypothetical protein
MECLFNLLNGNSLKGILLNGMVFNSLNGISLKGISLNIILLNGMFI